MLKGIIMKVIHSGDDGYTNIGDRRIPKDSPIVEFLGCLDELISFLGIVRSSLNMGGNNNSSFRNISENLKKIQLSLMLMASTIAKTENIHKMDVDFKKQVMEIEKEISELSNKMTINKRFVVPGTSRESALLHYARALCRRVERRAASLLRDKSLDKHAYAYLNRLSDLLYIYAIFVDFTRNIKVEYALFLDQ